MLDMYVGVYIGRNPGREEISHQIYKEVVEIEISLNSAYSTNYIYFKIKLI